MSERIHAPLVQPALPARAPAPTLQRLPALQLQRKASCPPGEKCPDERDEEKKHRLQRAEASPSMAGADSPSNTARAINTVMNTPGQPLDPGTRGDMEQRFGHDFSRVRVHSDSAAASAARSVNALAYTVGNHIAFDPQHYQPASPRGRQLIAHELAHTIQQSGLQRFPSAESGFSFHSSAYQALEREADAAAAQALADPQPASRPRLTAGGLHVARAERSWQPLPAELTLPRHRVTHRHQLDPQEPNPASVAFRVDKFLLPAEKGPVEQVYRDRAQANALEATVSFTGNNPNAGLWQSRADTADLRTNWMIKTGWNRLPRTEQANRWHQAGGIAPGPGTFPAVNPRVSSSGCDMDHIVELQLGGQNIPANLQVLNATDNQGSGRAIWEQVRQLAVDIRQGLPDPKPSEIILSFAAAEQVGGARPMLPAAPAGQAASCTQVECAVLGGLTSATGGAAPALPGEAYGVDCAGSAVTFQANPSPADTDLLNSGPENLAGAELIPGVILRTLSRPGSGRDSVAAFIESQAYFKRSKTTRVPLALQSSQAALTFDVQQAGARRSLRLRGGSPQVGFTYPYLSAGTMRLSYDAAAGLSGRGTLTPSLPMLNRTPLNVEFGQDRLRFFYEAVRMPRQTAIPGLRLTEATLGLDLLPEFHPYGRVGFAVGPGSRTLLTGLLEASADAGGLVMTGDLIAQIPNVDEARGRIEYRNRQLNGFVEISSTQIRIPGVQGGSLRIDYTSAGIVPSGSVSLLVAGQTVDLFARYQRERFIFGGEGTFTLPGLQPLRARVETDGTNVSITGSTGVTLRYMSGNMTVNYRNGLWSGRGTVNVNHGRANGTANLNLSESGRVFGDGRLSYRISDNLTAGMGIVLAENGQVRVSGDITLATIQLFQRFPQRGGRTRLFGLHIGIPILGFSLGPLGDVGLVLAIDPEIGVYYGIGPGELRDARITTAFNPFEDDPNIEFSAGAMLYIPFDAGFYLSVPCALTIDAVLAEAAAGLDVTTDVGVRGNFSASTLLSYRLPAWTLTATAGLYVNPRLALRVDGFLRASAGIGPLERSIEKRWNLRSWSWGSSMQFGVEFPFRYASNEPFQAPSFDDIRFIYPQNLSFERMLRDIVDQAS